MNGLSLVSSIYEGIIVEAVVEAVGYRNNPLKSVEEVAELPSIRESGWPVVDTLVHLAYLRLSLAARIIVLEA